MATSSHIMIIGASHAGLSCAERLRRGGFDGQITILERDPGLPLQRPPLSKTYLKADLTDGEGAFALRKEDWFDNFKITFRPACAVASLHPVHQQLSLTDGSTLSYDHLVLATGALARPLPKAADAPNLHVLRTAGDARLLRAGLANVRTALVIGGGYIGLEMGTVYAELGSQVSVVELTDGLLPGADRDLVKPLHKRLKGLFGAIRLNTKVVGLKDVGNGVEVSFEGPDGETTQTFSRVLVAVGRRPNSDGIGLENTNVVVDPKGFVEVDKQQRTGDAHIFAIGDVCGEPMLAHRASHQGKVAVESIHGEPAMFDPRAIPAVVFTDPEIAWAGLTEQEAELSGREIEISRYPWAASGRAHALGRIEGMTKILVDPETEQVLGVGIVGSGAGELIAEGALAIEMGCTARDLSETIHPHPTLGETVAFSAENYFGLATEIFRPRTASTTR